MTLQGEERAGVERDHRPVGAEGDLAILVHRGEAAGDGFDPAAVAHPFEGEPLDLHRLAAARILQRTLDLAAEHLEIDRALRQAPGERARGDQHGEGREGQDLDEKTLGPRASTHGPRAHAGGRGGWS